MSSVEPVATFMRTAWGWPVVESIHFVGLTLLFGSITVWDLRLLGVARHIPITSFHHLIPFAVVGFATNAATGSLFLMTEPDQYIYNPAFHFKLLFIALAGLNVLIFYLTVFRRASAPGAPADPPLGAKVAGAASLCLWAGVIVCGRFITFYRPFPCREDEALAFLLRCL